MNHLGRLSHALAVTLALSGCASLPSEGPGRYLVEQTATTPANTAGFVLITMSRHVADYLRVKPQPGFGDRFGKGKPSRAEQIGIGDVLQVRIWEADQAGLFASAGTVDRGAIPDVVVDTAGNILIPYAGTIRAAGRTPPQVAAAIVERLQQKTVEPQAHVSRLHNVANVVTVTGEVNTPNIYPMTLRGDTLLDVIAAAGGTRHPAYESLITLTRNGNTVTAYLEQVLESPEDNVYMRPGDQLNIARRPKTYTAFGAVERKGNIDFGSASLSVLEAVGKVSGLVDQLSDPRGVFLMRFEPAAVAYALSGQADPGDGRQIVPVIYRIDLKDPNQYFFAQVIGLQDRDILYVATAPSVELDKFLTIIGKAVGNVAAGASLGHRLGDL